ncbi:hypothetical protein STRIP9103_03265, partial [Streptomyces ipomoeae 91-03]
RGTGLSLEKRSADMSLSR